VIDLEEFCFRARQPIRSKAFHTGSSVLAFLPKSEKIDSFLQLFISVALQLKVAFMRKISFFVWKYILHTFLYKLVKRILQTNTGKLNFLNLNYFFLYANDHVPSFWMRLSDPQSYRCTTHGTQSFLFCVKVPVLSVQIVEVDPNVSTAWRFSPSNSSRPFVLPLMSNIQSPLARDLPVLGQQLTNKRTQLIQSMNI